MAEPDRQTTPAHTREDSADADASIPVARFDEAYETGVPPWDIDGPQPEFRRLVEAGAITGSVLDVGCGTGEHALYYAAGGLDVLGIDASAVAVRRAREKAAERGLSSVRFAVADVQELGGLGETFDTITDCGCLHALSDEAQARAIESARAVLRPGGTYWLMCFNERASPGPRRLSRERIGALFAGGWEVTDVRPTRFELTAAAQGIDAQAWLARIERRP